MAKSRPHATEMCRIATPPSVRRRFWYRNIDDLAFAKTWASAPDTPSRQAQGTAHKHGPPVSTSCTLASPTPCSSSASSSLSSSPRILHHHLLLLHIPSKSPLASSSSSVPISHVHFLRNHFLASQLLVLQATLPRISLFTLLVDLPCRFDNPDMPPQHTRPPCIRSMNSCPWSRMPSAEALTACSRKWGKTMQSR